MKRILNFSQGETLVAHITETCMVSDFTGYPEVLVAAKLINCSVVCSIHVVIKLQFNAKNTLRNTLNL